MTDSQHPGSLTTQLHGHTAITPHHPLTLRPTNSRCRTETCRQVQSEIHTVANRDMDITSPMP